MLQCTAVRHSQILSFRPLRACREVRSHLARRESGAAAPTAEHSQARRTPTLGFRVFPLSVQAVHLRYDCRPLRAYREVRAHPARRELAPQLQPPAFDARCATTLGLRVPPRGVGRRLPSVSGMLRSARVWRTVSRVPQPQRHSICGQVGFHAWLAGSSRAGPCGRACRRLGHIVTCARVPFAVSRALQRQPHSIRRPGGRPR